MCKTFNFYLNATSFIDLPYKNTFTDVDECQHEGDLNGHHCHSNTKCVNTPGSYECECLPGYKQVDKFNCAEVDECSTNAHNCDPNAECINTPGSYQCVCHEGYTGDGYSCQRKSFLW